jgi:hypothetical protein
MGDYQELTLSPAYISGSLGREKPTVQDKEVAFEEVFTFRLIYLWADKKIFALFFIVNM